mmetsp:Transcript_26535/g.57530  ORF Transcript_26535/g.57530 Transcript_26535/m.57530 type:complete len:236 (+) Transcript_26535:514-1221(+)
MGFCGGCMGVCCGGCMIGFCCWAGCDTNGGWFAGGAGGGGGGGIGGIDGDWICGAGAGAGGETGLCGVEAPCLMLGCMGPLGGCMGGGAGGPTGTGSISDSGAPELKLFGPARGMVCAGPDTILPLYTSIGLRGPCGGGAPGADVGCGDCWASWPADSSCHISETMEGYCCSSPVPGTLCVLCDLRPGGTSAAGVVNHATSEACELPTGETEMHRTRKVVAGSSLFNRASLYGPE